MVVTVSPEEIATAFSAHRFGEAYPHLSGSVRWVLAGGPTLVGAPAVVDACGQTLAGLAAVTTEFSRFLVIAGDRGVAVDVVADYTGADGSVSRVSSCDLYLFSDGLISEITSYTVELAVEPEGDSSVDIAGDRQRSAVDEQAADRTEQPLGPA